jgi:S-disulfanyl-L-cysteine oxidoreductase SoxD
MSTSERAATRALLATLVALGWSFCGWAQSARVPEGPKLGVPVTEADAASWNISVGPDGAGLPPGKGTATTGAALYQAKCLACHGEKGTGKPSDQLAGGQGTLRDATAVRTVGSYWPYATTLFDYVRRAMPYVAPQSLTPDEVYSLSAYILYLNGVIAENDEMNATTLPKVKMPNRDNFVSAYSEPKHPMR